MATRQRQFPELVEIYTAIAARETLEVYSITETDAAINAAVGTLATDVSDLQGDVSDLQTDISNLQGDVSDLQTDVSDLQTAVVNLNTDIENVDTSLTIKIAEECIQSLEDTGSNTTANGTLEVVINGTTYYLLTAATLN